MKTTSKPGGTISMTGKLYAAGSDQCLKQVDLSAHEVGELPQVIIYQDTCYSYTRITARGTVAEYHPTKTLRVGD